MRPPRLPLVPALVPAAALALVLALVLAGCTAAVSVAPGPGAADPVCAEVLAAVPDDLGGLEPRETTAQAAAAWGEPAVVLRCGVEPLGPTTERCLTVETPDGVAVDWVAVPGDGATTYTTYGREPALELVVPAADGVPLPATLLGEVAPAVALAASTRACVGPGD